MTAESVVYVVDDDPAMRESLSLLLCAVGYRASAHASGAEFLAALERGDGCEARCVITDLHMPGMGGLELQERLGAGAHAMPVVVVTGQGDVPAAVRALKGGALDFIEKPFTAEVMLERVREALARDRETRAHDARVRHAEQQLEALTGRELQVMDRLLDGCANKVVAFDLGISERTVEQHRARLMRKLGVRSVPELMQIVIAAGRQPEP